MLITPLTSFAGAPPGWQRAPGREFARGISLPHPRRAGGRAELPSPGGRGTGNAPCLERGGWWLACPGQSWPVGSGHTQLRPDQSSREGPGHPSATAQQSRALPGQVCAAWRVSAELSTLGGAGGKNTFPVQRWRVSRARRSPPSCPGRDCVGHSSGAEAANAARSPGRAEMLSRAEGTLPRHSCLLCAFGEGGRRVAVRPKGTLRPPVQPWESS